MDKVEILLPVFVPGRCAESAAESSPIYVRGSYLPIFQLYTYMKPHLPVSLFHALVAAVVAFPAVTFGGISDVPNGYAQITVTQPSDVAGSQKQAAFLLKSANNVSNFTITWNPAYSLFTDGIKDVLFTSWSNDNPGSINMSSGGKLLTVGDLTFVGLNNLTVDSSTVDVGVKTNFAFMGGVMAAGLPEISDETDTLGDLAGFTDNGDTFSIRNNRNINITRNVTTVDVATEGNEMRKGHALGGTLGGVTMEIANNKDVSIQANKLVLSVDGGDGTEAFGCGGAVFGNDVRIVNNEDVVFQGNRLSVTSARGGDALGAAVGALNSITIAGNDSVTFRNNGVYASFRDGEAYYLESIGMKTDYKGALNVSAGANSSVTFYDPINVDCAVSINAPYTNAAGATEQAAGDVIFSARNVLEDLTAFKAEGANPEEANPTAPSAEEVTLSSTSLALGVTTVHGGRMMVTDGAVYMTGAFIAGNNSTLYLNNGAVAASVFDDVEVNQGDGRVVFSAGSKLHVKGTGSTIEAVGIVFDGNNSLTFEVNALNLTASGVLLNSETSVTFNAGSTINLVVDSPLTDGKYKLMEMGEAVALDGWTSANLTAIGAPEIGFDVTYANLRWETEGALRVLYYYTTLPALLDATWANGDGDFVWSSVAINWEQNGQAYAFSNGASATFTDTAAGTVTLKGELRPSMVLVDNTTAGAYEWVADPSGGKLAGDMKLTKQGDGSLKISLANDYSGGTELLNGTLIAGHEKAFGTGDITVKGGNLELGEYAVSNNVMVNSGTFSGTAYAGTLSVTGTATIGENTTASSVVLKAATITGGSLKDTSITAEGVTIETLLVGKTNLTVLGNTVLRGDHSTTGLITVQNGMLSLQGSTTADMDLQGGSLNPETPLVLVSGQDVKFSGGNLQGSLESAADSSISYTDISSVSGELTLNGGKLIPGGPGITLQVGGALTILSDTVLDVNNYENGGNYVLVNAGSISGDLAMLTPVTDTRNVNTLAVSGSSLMLKVEENPATLYWKSGQVGVWSQLGDQEWDTDADDARFYNRDKVVFNNGGTVEIVGDVRPASIEVDGSEDVSFGGSGSIVGKASLIKRGKGTLNMNAANTYEGGTSIEDGTVNAGGADSFGSGDIELTGGKLNMGEYAVKNNVIARGGEFSGTAYDGKLSIMGDVTVGDDTTAAQVALEGGSVKGGSLKDTDIIATGPASIDVALKGDTSITVMDSETVLRGKNSSTGDMTVNDGALRIAREEALGAGNIYLNGGRMVADEGVQLVLSGKQGLYFRGGSLTGNVRTGNATAIVLDRNAKLDGNLRLNGGTVYFNGMKDSQKRSMAVVSDGCKLTVSGSITLTADTLVQLEAGKYADGDVLMESSSLTGDFGQLVLNYDDGNPNTEYALTLKETEGKVQVLLDLDKVYEHTNGKWSISNSELRDLMVQSNWGMFAASHAFADALQGQRSASGAVGENGPSVWVSALYNSMSVGDDGVKRGSDTSTLGAAFGIETMLGKTSCVGLAIGVNTTDVTPDGMLDEMEQDGTYVGVYGASVIKRLSDTSGITFSWSAVYGSVESTPSRASSMSWEQDSLQLNGRLDWSRSISDTTTVNVFGGLEYYMNTGDTVAGVDSGEIRNLRAEFGTGITRRYASTVMYAEARFLGDLMRDNPMPSVNGWCAEGANPGTVGAGVRVGAAYDINASWSVGANAALEVMGDAVNYSANINTSIKF